MSSLQLGLFSAPRRSVDPQVKASHSSRNRLRRVKSAPDILQTPRSLPLLTPTIGSLLRLRGAATAVNRQKEHVRKQCTADRQMKYGDYSIHHPRPLPGPPIRMFDTDPEPEPVIVPVTSRRGEFRLCPPCPRGSDVQWEAKHNEGYRYALQPLWDLWEDIREGGFEHLGISLPLPPQPPAPVKKRTKPRPRPPVPIPPPSPPLPSPPPSPTPKKRAAEVIVAKPRAAWKATVEAVHKLEDVGSKLNPFTAKEPRSRSISISFPVAWEVPFQKAPPIVTVPSASDVAPQDGQAPPIPVARQTDYDAPTYESALPETPGHESQEPVSGKLEKDKRTYFFFDFDGQVPKPLPPRAPEPESTKSTKSKNPVRRLVHRASETNLGRDLEPKLADLPRGLYRKISEGENLRIWARETTGWTERKVADFSEEEDDIDPRLKYLLKPKRVPKPKPNFSDPTQPPTPREPVPKPNLNFSPPTRPPTPGKPTPGNTPVVDYKPGSWKEGYDPLFDARDHAKDKWRDISDLALLSDGRRQVKSPRIGRAPPLSRCRAESLFIASNTRAEACWPSSEPSVHKSASNRDTPATYFDKVLANQVKDQVRLIDRRAAASNPTQQTTSGPTNLPTVDQNVVPDGVDQEAELPWDTLADPSSPSAQRSTRLQASKSSNKLSSTDHDQAHRDAQSPDGTLPLRRNDLERFSREFFEDFKPGEDEVLDAYVKEEDLYDKPLPSSPIVRHLANEFKMQGSAQLLRRQKAFNLKPYTSPVLVLGDATEVGDAGRTRETSRTLRLSQVHRQTSYAKSTLKRRGINSNQKQEETDSSKRRTYRRGEGLHKNDADEVQTSKQNAEVQEGENPTNVTDSNDLITFTPPDKPNGESENNVPASAEEIDLISFTPPDNSTSTPGVNSSEGQVKKNATTSVDESDLINLVTPESAKEEQEERTTSTSSRKRPNLRIDSYMVARGGKGGSFSYQFPVTPSPTSSIASPAFSSRGSISKPPRLPLVAKERPSSLTPKVFSDPSDRDSDNERLSPIESFPVLEALVFGLPEIAEDSDTSLSSPRSIPKNLSQPRRRPLEPIVPELVDKAGNAGRYSVVGGVYNKDLSARRMSSAGRRVFSGEAPQPLALSTSASKRIRRTSTIFSAGSTPLTLKLGSQLVPVRPAEIEPEEPHAPVFSLKHKPLIGASDAARPQTPIGVGVGGTGTGIGMNRGRDSSSQSGSDDRPNAIRATLASAPAAPGDKTPSRSPLTVSLSEYQPYRPPLEPKKVNSGCPFLRPPREPFTHLRSLPPPEEPSPKSQEVAALPLDGFQYKSVYQPPDHKPSSHEVSPSPLQQVPSAGFAVQYPKQRVPSRAAPGSSSTSASRSQKPGKGSDDGRFVRQRFPSFHEIENFPVGAGYQERSQENSSIKPSSHRPSLGTRRKTTVPIPRYRPRPPIPTSVSSQGHLPTVFPPRELPHNGSQERFPPRKSSATTVVCKSDSPELGLCNDSPYPSIIPTPKVRKNSADSGKYFDSEFPAPPRARQPTISSIQRQHGALSTTQARSRNRPSEVVVIKSQVIGKVTQEGPVPTPGQKTTHASPSSSEEIHILDLPNIEPSLPALPTTQPSLIAQYQAQTQYSQEQPLVEIFTATPTAVSKNWLDDLTEEQIADPEFWKSMAERLQIRSGDAAKAKAQALEDARLMQMKVIEDCKKANKEPPIFALEELIGKGAYGRVYKGKNMQTAETVAVKIIDVDESDTVNPRNADSYSEFLREVSALKTLTHNGAKNINRIIDAIPVGQSMWMVTEHCGGGSVATLMKPTPRGLAEKWIIPIAREVSEAVYWVHMNGIIHRDIKCANVLVTEQGGLQLCDFGVVAILEEKFDKRSTIIGTPHWMAPEVFGAETVPYGKEVDVWALGCMFYEMATGYPPNATNVSQGELGTYLKTHAPPRLEGGDYSDNLRDLIAYCLEEDSSSRPVIEEIQKHAYISGTADEYPVSTLRSLVGSFRVWEARGGVRKSLFYQPPGAPTPSAATPAPKEEIEWNFSTTEIFEDSYKNEFSARDVYDAYGPSVVDFDEDTATVSKPATKPNRRRPPPGALAHIPGPLEKVFDANTMSNYEDNSRVHYGRQMPPPTSDLPLRDDSAQVSIRDTMIDLGGHDAATGISSFIDMDTIKPSRSHQADAEPEFGSAGHDFSRPALSDPAEPNSNRRTQDWKFPSMNPASADPELSRFPVTYEVPRPMVTPGSGGRPTLIHHPTEPVGAFGGGLLNAAPAAADRRSLAESLIDLDMSLPDPSEFRRPSTANSDVGSTTSEQMVSANPFDLERHASQYNPFQNGGGREPSIYVSDEVSTGLRNANGLQDIVDMSDFSASDAEGAYNNDYRGARNGTRGYDSADDGYYITEAAGPNDRTSLHPRMAQYDGPGEDYDSSSAATYNSMPPPPVPRQGLSSMTDLQSRLPNLIDPPTVESLSGSTDKAVMKGEITRMLTGMGAQLQAFVDIYDSKDIIQKRGSGQSLSRRTGEDQGI